MMRNIKVLSIVALIVALVAAALLAYTPTASRNRSVAVGAVGKTGMMGMIFSYGQEKGIFEKYNLNVTYHRFKDAYTNFLAVLTGKVDVSTPSPGMTGIAYSDGEPIRIGLVVGKATNMMLLARPGIERAEDLRGMKIGVIGTASDSYQITKWYLDKKGIELGKDAEIVEIKSPSSLVASYKSGQLDAAILFSGYAAELINSDAVVLVRCSEAGEETFGHTTYTSVMVHTERFVERGAVSRDFFRAVREICTEISNNQDEVAEIQAAFAEEPVEKLRTVMELVTLVGDLDHQIQEDLIAFSEYAVQEEYFDKAFSDQIFFDEWR
jgi:ABC-type nitrate/sulfonate/bicarbonate transport system substrate-binding protein